MKIEENKTYKDRSGEAWLIKAYTSPDYPFVGTKVGAARQRTYTAEGNYYEDRTYSTADLVEEVNAPKPHKHKDVMIALANDSSTEIQWRNLSRSGDTWRDIAQGYTPEFSETTEYRIKPKGEPLVAYAKAQREDGNVVTVKYIGVTKDASDNLRLTFDPSGVLVKAEVV